MTIGLRIGLLLCCLSPGSAQALNHAGVEIAPMVRAEGQSRPWPLLGSAMVHRSFIPFYGLALHGPADALVHGEIGQGMTPLQITLVWYANELPKAQVEAHFRELFERVTDAETRQRVAPRLQKFIAILPAAKRGNSMVFYYDPDGGTQVSIDGDTLGHFAGIEFNRALLSMWLGPAADRAVREGLTGAPES
jgi:hypothetical protein